VKILFFALGVSLSTVAFATGTACATSAPGGALNSYPSGNTPSFGCTQVDVAFDNFSVTTGGVNNVPAPGIGDVSMFGAGSSPTVDAYFNTPGPGATWSVIGNPIGQLDSILSYTATTTNEFTGLAIPLIGADFSGTGSTFTITETYCLGQTSVSACPVGQSGSFEVEVAGSSLFFNTGPVTFAPTFNMVAIQEEIVMQNGYTLITLPNEFDESGPAGAPEPSTVALLGTALAGLFLFRRKLT
jgi:hypothetical protein